MDLTVGDVVRVGATGARSVTREGIVEVIGPLLTGSVAADGSVVEAQGVSATVLLIARGPGEARLEVVVAGTAAPPSWRPVTVRVAAG